MWACRLGLNLSFMGVAVGVKIEANTHSVSGTGPSTSNGIWPGLQPSMGIEIAFNFQWGLKKPSDLNGFRRGLLTYVFLVGGCSYLHLVAGVFPEPCSQSGGGTKSKDGSFDRDGSFDTDGVL